jgi:septum formation protein
MGIVLASRSPVRAHLLKAAGVSFDLEAADIDEDAIRSQMRHSAAEGEDLALSAAKSLAREKAKKISQLRPQALVLGADQTLSCEGRLFEKPASLEAAREELMSLRGKAHHLYIAIAAMRAGAPVWQHSESVRLVMRDFSDRFLDDYLAAEGMRLLSYVGAYALEGRGSQLFRRVEGDYFSVLGLPLLPLLAFLRAEGELPT